jgi:hypothetical protein
MKKIINIIIVGFLTFGLTINAKEKYVLFSNDEVAISLEKTKVPDPEATTYDLASTKVSCDSVEFNLNPAALIQDVIDNAITEAMNALGATAISPDEIVDMIIDSVIGTVCLLQNPMEIQKQVQAGMACTGKMNPGSTDMGGDGGIANGYVYPVPSVAATMNMNIDMSTVKAMGSCFADVAQEFQACQQESEDPNCKFATCFYNMRKEFFDLLNTKIRTAEYNKSAIGAVKTKQCEYKKLKNNKIFDAMNMNPADQDSYLSNFESTLSEIGVASEIGDNTPPEDLNEEEKAEYEAFMKNMAGNLTDATVSNKIAKAIEASDKAKLEACGEAVEVESNLPTITTMSSRNFNALDFEILDKSKINFDISVIFDNNIGITTFDLKASFFKLELYKYFMGFNPQEEFLNDEGMLTPTELEFLNKTPLLSAMDNDFLLLPNLNKTRLTPRNRMLLTTTFCKSLEGIEEDDEEFKTLINDIYINNIQDNDYSDMCDYIECPSALNDKKLNSKIPKNYLREDFYTREIIEFINYKICPNSIEIYNKMVSGDKVKNLISINKATLKRFVKSKIMMEKNKANTKEEDRDDKADVTILKTPNIMANNIKEVKRSWESADSHIQNVISETLYWGIKK